MYKTHLVDVLFLHVSVLQHLLNRLHGLPEEIHVKLFKLGASKSLRKVISIFEALNLKPGTLLTRQRALSLLDLPLKLADSSQVLADVSSGLLLVRFDHMIHNPIVKVFTTKMGVSGSSQDFEYTIVNGKEGYIKGTSSEVVDNDLRFTAFLVETVGNGGCGRLVDDTQDLETSDGTGVLRRLALSIVKVYKYSSLRRRKRQ